jgi:nucleoside 2-deoxyribosyltransferase
MKKNKSQRVRVYIASPYTNGDKEYLVNLQVDAAYHLLKMGFNPFMPLHGHYIQVRHTDLNSTFPWLEVDKAWLKECDMVIRIHPKDNFNKEIPSSGADEEEAYAKELGIPVFHFDTLEEMVRVVQTFSNTI